MEKADRFQVVKFADKAAFFSESPLTATQQNIAGAAGYLDMEPAGGTTGMLPALKKVLNIAPAEGRDRTVFLITEGYIGNEAAVLNTLREYQGDTRIYIVGIGSSVNRHLLETLGYMSGGQTRIIRQDGDVREAVEEMLEAFGGPVLKNMSIAWEGILAGQVVPARMADLFGDRPLTISGK